MSKLNEMALVNKAARKTSSDELPISDAQVLALQREASEAGDDAQVALCVKALRGNVSARAKCAAVIADAAAQS